MCALSFCFPFLPSEILSVYKKERFNFFQNQMRGHQAAIVEPLGRLIENESQPAKIHRVAFPQWKEGDIFPNFLILIKNTKTKV